MKIPNVAIAFVRAHGGTVVSSVAKFTPVLRAIVWHVWSSLTAITYVRTPVDVMDVTNSAYALRWAHGRTMVLSIANITRSSCAVLRAIAGHVWSSLTAITYVRTPVDVMGATNTTYALVRALGLLVCFSANPTFSSSTLGTSDFCQIDSNGMSTC